MLSWETMYCNSTVSIEQKQCKMSLQEKKKLPTILQIGITNQKVSPFFIIYYYYLYLLCFVDRSIDHLYLCYFFKNFLSSHSAYWIFDPKVRVYEKCRVWNNWSLSLSPWWWKSDSWSWWCIESTDKRISVLRWYNGSTFLLSAF